MLGLLLGCVGCIGRRAPEPPETRAIQPRDEGALRLVSFNAWGVPFRDRHEELLLAIAPALEALSPDVVVLQEVWREEDAARLGEALEAIGLVHEVHHASSAVLSFDSSGLMIASRWPLSHPRYHAFTAGRLPVRPWHVDWFSGKGVVSAKVAHPSGTFRIGTVHLQADYDGIVYTEVRLAQTSEVIAELRRHPVSVLAGDFNSGEEALEHRVAREALGLSSASRRGVDDVLVGPEVTVLDAWQSSAPGLELDGVEMAISDHALLVADLRIGRPERRRPALDPATRDALEAWLDERERHRAWKRTGGWAALLLGFALVGASSESRQRGYGRLVRAALLALALLAAAGAYLGVGVGTAGDQWRAQTRATLLDG